MTERPSNRLLPDVAAGYLRDNFDAQVLAWPLDHGALSRQSDPMTCDEVLLPHLFFDRGGLVWSDAWPVEKRRRVVRDLFTYKRMEGTPAGVEAYINLADGFLTREELPPGHAYLIPEDTLDYDGVLALMPQLRLYHDHPPSYEPASFFWGASHWSLEFWTPETASPLGRYPVLWDAGVETPLTASDLKLDGKVARLYHPGDSGNAAFWGSETFYWGENHFGETYEFPPIVFDLADPSLSRQRLPSFAYAEEAYWGATHWSASYWMPDSALGGVYDRLYLWEPSRIPQHVSAMTAGAFWGAFRYGVPNYHCLLEVALPEPGGLPGAWMHWGEGYWLPQDPGPIAFLMEAVEAARRPGDRILIELAPTAAGVYAPPLPDLDPEPT